MRTLLVLHWPEKHSLWPALKGGDGEEGHHGSQDIVKVKLAVLPAPGLYHGLADLPILVGDVVPSVGGEGRQNVAELLCWHQAPRAAKGRGWKSSDPPAFCFCLLGAVSAAVQLALGKEERGMKLLLVWYIYVYVLNTCCQEGGERQGDKSRHKKRE